MHSIYAHADSRCELRVSVYTLTQFQFKIVMKSHYFYTWLLICDCRRSTCVCVCSVHYELLCKFLPCTKAFVVVGYLLAKELWLWYVTTIFVHDVHDRKWEYALYIHICNIHHQSEDVVCAICVRRTLWCILSILIAVKRCRNRK